MPILLKIKRYLMGIGVLLIRLIVIPFGFCKIYKEAKVSEEEVGSPPSSAEINIDSTTIQAEIDPFLYGNFIEVLGACIYGGIWDEYNPHVPKIHGGIRQDVLEEIRNLKVTILRWPGGCFSDVYNWKDGIGPRSERKVVSNKHWHWLGPKIGPKHDNHFGSNEFMALINEIGAEPYININFGSGTIEEAAQWVEYMNGDESTEFGALRAKDGHSAPYNVKIWGIGNEINLPTETGCTSAERYANLYLEFVKAMQKIDPSLKFVAVGTDYTHDPNWNRKVLQIAGDHIDYLSLHVYPPGFFLATLSNDVQDFYNIIAGAFEIERRIQWMAENITEVMGTKTIPIALDEWGIIWNVRQHYEGYYTLRDGLFAASVFEILHRNAHSVKMANYAQLVNVVPMIVTNETDVYHNPIYLAALLFANYAESQLVSFTVKCDTRHIPPYGNIAETNLPYLGCSVTMNKSKTRLVIIGINRHHAHAILTTISIEGFNPASHAQVLELNGPSHSAYNDFTKKDEVQIYKKDPIPVSEQFTYSFPAHSVTVLIITKKDSSKNE
ncbi:MAG: alpha-L-arabinofuranosidase C-terminal domain-containing protein [Candidatus Helarchaeota archaeon]